MYNLRGSCVAGTLCPGSAVLIKQLAQYVMSYMLRAVPGLPLFSRRTPRAPLRAREHITLQREGLVYDHGEGVVYDHREGGLV